MYIRKNRLKRFSARKLVVIYDWKVSKCNSIALPRFWLQTLYTITEYFYLLARLIRIGMDYRSLAIIDFSVHCLIYMSVVRYEDTNYVHVSPLDLLR